MPQWCHNLIIEQEFGKLDRVTLSVQSKFGVVLNQKIKEKPWLKSNRDRIRRSLHSLLLKEERILKLSQPEPVIEKLINEDQADLTSKDLSTLLTLMAISDNAAEIYGTWLIKECYRNASIYFQHHLDWIISDKRKTESESDIFKTIKDGTYFLSDIRNLNCHYTQKGCLSPFEDNMEKEKFRHLCEKVLRYLITSVHPDNVDEMVSTGNFTVLSYYVHN